VNQSALISKLAAIVGNSAVMPFEQLPAIWQANLQACQRPERSPQAIVYPRNPAELAEIVACAAHNHWRILPCGQGSKLNWGGLLQDIDLVISSQHLNQLIDHAAGDMTVTVQAGMRFAQLQDSLSQVKQMVALDPSFPGQASIGGIVASRDGGALRHRYGGVRDFVLGVSFVRSDGQLVKAGGRVVKNVAGYDLMKLFTGSFGSLGMITELTLRLYPQPETSQTLLITGSPTTLSPLLQTLLRSSLTPTSVDLLSNEILVTRFGLTATMGLLVRFQGLAASVPQQLQTLQTWVDATPVDSAQLRVEVFKEDDQLWPQLQTHMDGACSCLCRIGCLPATSPATLANLTQLCQAANVQMWGRIHAGFGVGMVRLQGEPDALLALLPKLRTCCQQAQGYLTLLQAPVALKQTALEQGFEIWGYAGNALELMRQIKHQFDPTQMFSPQRFVGGI
jgi:glycolate oxidase FAD binding subunit